jgi:starch synthase (maltosyl-transferring)
VILVVVNLDPRNPQSGWTSLDLGELGVGTMESFEVQDLLTGATHIWQGSSNFVRLDARGEPAHVFRVRPRRSSRETAR